MEIDLQIFQVHCLFCVDYYYEVASFSKTLTWGQGWGVCFLNIFLSFFCLVIVVVFFTLCGAGVSCLKILKIFNNKTN